MITTPQAVIDAWRPHREAIRPPQCDHRAGCWVVDPFGATKRTAGCATCGGRLQVRGFVENREGSDNGNQ